MNFQLYSTTHTHKYTTISTRFLIFMVWGRCIGKTQVSRNSTSYTACNNVIVIIRMKSCFRAYLSYAFSKFYTARKTLGIVNIRKTNKVATSVNVKTALRRARVRHTFSRASTCPRDRVFSPPRRTKNHSFRSVNITTNRGPIIFFLDRRVTHYAHAP